MTAVLPATKSTSKPTGLTAGAKRAHPYRPRRLKLWRVEIPFAGTWVFPNGVQAECQNGLSVYVAAYDACSARAEAKKLLGIDCKGRLPRGSIASIHYDPCKVSVVPDSPHTQG